MEISVYIRIHENTARYQAQTIDGAWAHFFAQCYCERINYVLSYFFMKLKEPCPYFLPVFMQETERFGPFKLRRRF